MLLIPKEAKKFELENSSVDFYMEEKEDETIYYFDTSLCVPPEPMINAMLGLQLLDEKSKLIMINKKPPMALFPRIQKDFSYNIEEKEDYYLIEFTKKDNGNTSTNFSDTTCGG